MTEDQRLEETIKMHAQDVKALQGEIKRLKRLVFQSTPIKSGALSRLFGKEKAHGFGGATDYEMWLRTLEYPDLYGLRDLFTGAIDGLRFRRRFVQHEIERRNLHSTYGEHSLEHLAKESKGLDNG